MSGDEFRMIMTIGLPVAVAWIAYKLTSLAYGAPLIYASRVKRVARQMGGQIVLGRSTVGGHAVWGRNGRPFYFYEREWQTGRWSVLSVGVEGGGLPRLQVRPRRGHAPLPIPPDIVEAPALATSLDAEFIRLFEVRLPASGAAVPPGEALVSALLEVARLTAPRVPVLEVYLNRCRLFLPGILRGARRSPALLEAGCRVLDAALYESLGPVPAGQFKVLDVHLHGEVTGGVCPVCGEPIERKFVTCMRCYTLHHRECWQYTGACATFGCGSRECES